MRVFFKIINETYQELVASKRGKHRMVYQCPD